MEGKDKYNEGLLTKKGSLKLDRRDFLKLAGGGIFILLLPNCLSGENENELSKDFNAFLQVGEDGTITCFTGKIEMGQGIHTALAQMMAEELNVQLEKIKMVMGDTDLCPYDAGTWGSLSIREFGPLMVVAVAEAKAVLLELASDKLKVPVNQLEVKDGVVFDTKNNTSTVSYAELTNGKRINKYLSKKPTPEDYNKYTIVGKSANRQDAFLKVTGQAKYTGDLKLPGMVFARILRPPSHGAKLKSVDFSEAEKIEGTKVLREGDLIAVTHENWDKAEEALKLIKAEYTFDELKVDDKSIFEWMLKAETDGKVDASAGDLDAGFKGCDKIVESEFHDPYIAHAPIEPHTALAQFENGKLTVWASAQSPFGLKDDLIREMKLTSDKVRVIVPFVGGGFGGKIDHRQGIEVAKLAKLAGKPVMLNWTRNEEFFHDTFHPAGVIKVKSGMDKSGKLFAWDYHAYFCGTRGTEVIYDIPNFKVFDHNSKNGAPPVHPFATGPWRAPNNNTNTFVREVQVDIMAHEFGEDPVEFRIRNLKDQKAIDCIKKAIELFGYTPAKGPSGRGYGIALGLDVGTYVVQIAEVKVDKSTGKVNVVRIVCVQDMGLCINPLGATLQMEGCITMGLGYTLAEELLFEGGKILNPSFAKYHIPRFSWLPKIETHIIQRINEPPHGGGEPAIITVGAVVGNAIFDATGARMFRMPMTPERILEALKQG
ncbi:MAG: molybdopterin cofactor-binding domain-containing protein [Bacteroidales bacterium]